MRLIASARGRVTMPIDKNQLRQVMGHFVTGVTIITTVNKDGQMHGLTANAFTSVSLEPPLLLISVDKKAESYPAFEESKVFTVNILADEQEALSRKFAVSGGNKFEGAAYRRGANGAAKLDGPLAHIETTFSASSKGGHPSLLPRGIQATPR